MSNIKTLTAGKATRKYVFGGKSGQKYKAKLKPEKGARRVWGAVMIERETYQGIDHLT